MLKKIISRGDFSMNDIDKAGIKYWENNWSLMLKDPFYFSNSVKK